MNETAFLDSLYTAGIAQCSAAIDGSGGLLFAMFMAGLAGGATHCLGMCTPFIVSQVQARLEAIPVDAMNEFKRLTGAALLPYHFGRATTYMALGAVGALASGQLSTLPMLNWMAAALLGIAALFFMAYALRGFGLSLPFMINNSNDDGALTRAWGRLMKPLFLRPVGLRGYGLGVALGFLPCGLVYGALAAAAASGEWLTAVFAMAAFWLGTVPALFGVGLAGGAILGQWPNVARKIAPILLLINAAFLIYLITKTLP